ncbi:MULTISPECIES: DUF6265 family protein [Sphingobacterium]|uniref:DUF6265 family protein n=1 Tax=Sphingobacterium TaxID=28453 RepID=UPI0019D245B3|nr:MULTISPECIES: DUF6265 family protein [Sphingobacterium]
MMKRIGLLVYTAVAVSCHQTIKSGPAATSTTASESTMETAVNLDWLNGNWKRVNEEKGKETFENWEKISVTEYAGFSYTLQKGDTVSQEQMSLIATDGKWSLFVKTPDEKRPIEFKLAELKSNEFVFTNDSIDFPKQIQYWTESGKLKAKVSNKDMEIPFEFEKIQ